MWVMRHAHAAPSPPNGPDLARPLDDRGRAQLRQLAPRLAPLVAAAPWTAPGLVLTSPARRARETAEALVPLLSAPEPKVEPTLWHGDEDDLAGLLRELDDALPSVMLVGHNPSVARLVAALVGPARAPDHFGPGTLALVSLAVPWSQVAGAVGELERLLTA